jgi:hypothetical protein
VTGADLAVILVEGDVTNPVQPVLDLPVAPQQPSQPGGVGLGGSQAGDRVGDLAAQDAPSKVGGVAVDNHDLGGVGEVDDVGDRGGADPAMLDAAVATVYGVVLRGTRPHREPIDRSDQARLVVLDHEQVIGLLVLDQPAGVGALGVQGIGGDDLTRQVHLLQQRWNSAISLGLPSTRRCAMTVPLPWASAANKCICLPARSRAPRRVLPSTATASTCPSDAASQSLTTWSSRSGSSCCSARRAVVCSGARRQSVQGRHGVPNRASTCWDSSRANSPIAA